MAAASSLSWPDELLDLAVVQTWIAETLDAASPADLRKVLWVKAWGVTARFTVAPSRDVVFKAELLPVAAQSPAVHRLLQRRAPSHVPRFLAGRALPAGSWLLLEPLTGTPVEVLDPLEGLPRMARAVAAVQAALSDVPDEGWRDIPTILPGAVPRL